MVMDSVKVWEVRLRLESPLILTRRRTETGFLNPLKYIPSTTLRGALVSALYREGYLDAKGLEKERQDPEIVASPAYPVYGGAKTFPAHPFISECKQCREIVGGGHIRDLERLVDGDVSGWSVECGRGHRALRPLHPGKFLSIVNGEFKPCDEGEKAGTLYSVSVAISKSRASGVSGLLYFYEALQPSLEFWATVAVPGFVSLPRDGFVLHVGRGVSRGFGRVVMNVVGDKHVMSRVSRCRVLYAISPTINISTNGGVSTYPRTIDLSWAGARLGMVSKSAVRVRRFFGRVERLSLGWDLASGAPRPWLTGRAAGSLLVLEEPCGDEALGALAYLGAVQNLNGSPLPGFNMLVPLEELVNYAS